MQWPIQLENGWRVHMMNLKSGGRHVMKHLMNSQEAWWKLSNLFSRSKFTEANRIFKKTDLDYYGIMVDVVPKIGFEIPTDQERLKLGWTPESLEMLKYLFENVYTPICHLAINAGDQDKKAKVSCWSFKTTNPQDDKRVAVLVSALGLTIIMKKNRKSYHFNVVTAYRNMDLYKERDLTAAQKSTVRRAQFHSLL